MSRRRAGPTTRDGIPDRAERPGCRKHHGRRRRQCIPFTLPGGLRTTISGIGVFYPDKSPTQRIGIVPDTEAWPAIDGFREGRNEVLEAAVRHILGPDADEEMMRRISQRP